MHKSFRLIIQTIIFFLFLTLIKDVGDIKRLKNLTKDSLDLSTKAATLQVDDKKAAEGIFEIDPNKANQVFLDMMSKNLSSSIETVEKGMIDYRAINTPQNYTDPGTGMTFKIKNPTYVASIKFKYDGLLLHEEYILSNNFAGSEIIDIYVEP